MPQKKKKVATELATADYREFVTSLQLIALSLKRSESVLDRESYFEALESKKKLTKEVSGAFKLEECGNDYFDAIAEYKLNVQARTGAPLLKLSCCFEAHFHTSKSVNNKFVRQFAEADISLIVWPYFRQFVSDMTSRMAIPPLTVPLSTSSVGAKYGI